VQNFKLFKIQIVSSLLTLLHSVNVKECLASLAVTFLTMTWARTRNVPFACLRYVRKNSSVEQTAVTASVIAASLNGAPSLQLAASAEPVSTKFKKFRGFY
jgi:hypothetical protein